MITCPKCKERMYSCYQQIRKKNTQGKDISASTGINDWVYCRKCNQMHKVMVELK